MRIVLGSISNPVKLRFSKINLNSHTVIPDNKFFPGGIKAQKAHCIVVRSF